MRHRVAVFRAGWIALMGLANWGKPRVAVNRRRVESVSVIAALVVLRRWGRSICEPGLVRVPEFRSQMLSLHIQFAQTRPGEHRRRPRDAPSVAVESRGIICVGYYLHVARPSDDTQDSSPTTVAMALSPNVYFPELPSVSAGGCSAGRATRCLVI